VVHQPARQASVVAVPSAALAEVVPSVVEAVPSVVVVAQVAAHSVAEDKFET
jgi:hypothetical protein